MAVLYYATEQQAFCYIHSIATCLVQLYVYTYIYRILVCLSVKYLRTQYICMYMCVISFTVVSLAVGNSIGTE